MSDKDEFVSAASVVLEDIFEELTEVVSVYGVRQFDPSRDLVILMEEVGEVARAVIDEDFEQYYAELKQVAACAIRMLSEYGKAQGQGVMHHSS
jgi:NTP pyrophosphatase (non-canonical NTP hydrolase)